MKIIQITLSMLLFAVSAVNAFELSDMRDRLLGDSATGIEGQLKDAGFELKVMSALLRSETLRNNAHILVSRYRGSVLIAGQAITQELKDKALSIVLEEARLQWTQGDVHHVEPSNAQVCGEKASKRAANDRRRFNLKTAEGCSAIKRLYNEVRVATPRNEIEQSDDDVRRATILNKLLHSSIVESTDAVKVVVSGRHVYLLGNQLSQQAANKVTAFVKKLPKVGFVIPLFTF